jgi:hypothetical protein
MQTDEPMPALPLEYYQQSTGPWRGILRLAAWGAVAYSLLTIAAAMPAIFFYWFPSMTGPSRIVLVGYQTIVMLVPVVCASGFLLVSAITLLRQGRAGRVMLMWACVSVAACTMLQSAIQMIRFAFGTPTYGSGFILYQLLSQSFGLLRGIFVPVSLLLLFRRQEMKEANGD